MEATDAQLEAVLEKCRSYAGQGRALASEAQAQIRATIAEEEERLKGAERAQGEIEHLENTKVLQRQLAGLESSRMMMRELERDLEELSASQKDFSLLVYGRTMVGKSTLMEVLTHGVGTNIGNGSQRTTRDVRDYHWKGMKITDVPGIASFDGAEDDDLALKAAKGANLVLFLISDDGVQQEEARHLAALRKLGKPVLGLINVKLGIAEPVRALDLRRLQKKMAETERLAAICDQLRAFAPQYGQDWSDIPFVPVHLKAAFLGQDKEAELYEVSHFSAVIEYIVEKVASDGCFLRFKTFADRAAISLQQQMEAVLMSSSRNLKEGLLYRHKWHDLDDWRSSFVEQIQEDFNSFIVRIFGKIVNGMEPFADIYYDYEGDDLGEIWAEYLVEGLGIRDDCESFLQKVVRQCERKKKELASDLAAEFAFDGMEGLDFDGIKGLGSIIDTRFIGSLVGGLAMLVSGPLGIGIGVLSWLFGDSKEEKIRKQKAQLVGQIAETAYDTRDAIGDKVIDILNEKILHDMVDALRDKLVAMDELLMKTADEERNLAENLAERLADLHRQVFAEAGAYLGRAIEPHTLARVPGQESLAFASTALAAEDRKKLSSLLGEKVTWTHCPSREQDPDTWKQRRDEARIRLIGESKYRTIEYGDDGKIVHLYLTGGQSLDSLQGAVAYQLVQQMRVAPTLEKS